MLPMLFVGATTHGAREGLVFFAQGRLLARRLPGLLHAVVARAHLAVLVLFALPCARLAREQAWRARQWVGQRRPHACP